MCQKSVSAPLVLAVRGFWRPVQRRTTCCPFPSPAAPDRARLFRRIAVARFPGGRVRVQGVALGQHATWGPRRPGQFAPGAGLRGAFRYIPNATAPMNWPGLNDVDAALELGLGLHYTADAWQVYADLRYGVIGHKAFVGEVGANLIYRAPGGLVLNAGPRAEFGSSALRQSLFRGHGGGSGPPSSFDAFTRLWRHLFGRVRTGRLPAA